MYPRNVAGSVVRGPDFWGRSGDVNEVWRRLERSDVLLTNPRRWGKSSLMAAMLDQPREGWTVVYIDVYAVESPQEFLVELSAGILAANRLVRALTKAKDAPTKVMRWFSSVIDEIGLGVPDVAELRVKVREKLPTGTDWRDEANALLDHVARGDGQVLIIVDEFPSMIATLLDRDRANALGVLKWMHTRRGPATQRGVRFLLGGSVNIEPLLESIGEQKHLHDLDRYHLQPFTTAQALEFVGLLLIGEGQPENEAFAAELVKVAQTGVPFFLQVLVSTCLTEARLKSLPLNSLNISAIFEEKVLGPEERYRFSHYMTRLREAYGADESAARFALGVLADATTMTTEKLRVRLRGAGLKVSDFDHLLARLVADYYIVIEDGNARFTSGFLQKWWRRNAPRGR